MCMGNLERELHLLGHEEVALKGLGLLSLTLLRLGHPVLVLPRMVGRVLR